MLPFKVVALGLGDKKGHFLIFFPHTMPQTFNPFYSLFDKNCTFGSKVTKEKLAMKNTEIIQNVSYPIIVNTCILFLMYFIVFQSVI